MKLLQANKPTNIWCIHNPDYEMEWDNDDYVFYVEYDEKYKNYQEINERIGEFLVYSPKFDFKSVYVGRREDFDEVEMF
jgi:hypothetical protein